MAIQVLSAVRPSVTSPQALQGQTSKQVGAGSQTSRQSPFGLHADTFESAPRSAGANGTARQTERSGFSAVVDGIKGFLGEVGGAVDHFLSSEDSKPDGSTAPGQSDQATTPTQSDDSARSTPSTSGDGSSGSGQ